MSGSLAGMSRMWDFSLLSILASRDSSSDLSSRETRLLYMMPQDYQEVETEAARSLKTRLWNSPLVTSTTSYRSKQITGQARIQGDRRLLFMVGVVKSQGKGETT